MICTTHESVWKLFKLNSYRQLFIIPIASHIAWLPINIGMVLYDIISKGYRELERSLKMKEYSEGMQIIDISFEIPRLIKTTYVFSLDNPFGLDKGHHMQNKKP